MSAVKKSGPGKALVRGSVVRVTASFVRMATGFIMMPFFVSHLGPTQYGLYVTATSVVANFYLLDVGYSAAVMRNVAVGLGAGDPTLVNRTIRAGLVIYSALAVAVLVLTGAAVLLAPRLVSSSGEVWAVQVVLLLTGINLALGFPVKAFAGIIQASVRYDLLAASQITTSLLSMVLNITLLLKGYGIVAIAITALACGQLGSLMYVLICRHLFPQMKLTGAGGIDREEIKRLTGYSVWAFLIQFGNQLRYKVDTLVVGYVFSASTVTTYHIGGRVSDYLKDVTYQATNMATPVLTTMHGAGEHARLRRSVALLFRLNVLIAVYATVGAWLWTGRFIEAWMGTGFGQAVLVSAVLVPAAMLQLATNPVISTAYATGHLRPLAVATAAEGLLNLALSIFLGRTLGLVGVALGTLIPMVLIRLVLVTPWAARLAGLSLGELVKESLWPFLAASATMTVLAFSTWPFRYVSHSVAVAIAVAITIVYWIVALNVGLTRPQRQALAGGLPHRLRGLANVALRAA